MNGAHPKAVQSVMRHSTITLTMDTYGHLFPGQDAATVARFPNMLSDEPKALRATGTADASATATGEGAQHKAQQLGAKKCRPMRPSATTRQGRAEKGLSATLCELPT